MTGKPKFLSNHAGGILGGISTGQPIVARFAVKPTSSILAPRKTIDMDGEETEIVTKGRHDPCVGIRAVPVGEAMMAWCWRIRRCAIARRSANALKLRHQFNMIWSKEIGLRVTGPASKSGFHQDGGIAGEAGGIAGHIGDPLYL